MPLPSRPCHLRLRRAEGRTIVQFVGPAVALDWQTTQAAQHQLLGVAAEIGRGELQIDCGNVVSLMAAALGMFLRLRRRLGASGGRLVLLRPTPQVLEVLHITRLGTIFEVRDG